MANGTQQGLSMREKTWLTAGLVALVMLLLVMAIPARTPQAPVTAPTPTIGEVRPGLTPEQELTLEALEAAAGVGVRAPAITSAQGTMLHALEARAGLPVRQAGIGER